MQVARPQDLKLKRLLKKFVCVRVVQGNALNLELFQFDYDLTFAAFFMNADRTIYGRYGTRSSQEKPERDISMQGFVSAIEGALELHASFPENRRSLAGKQGGKPRYPTPERYPTLKRYTPLLNYGGKVAQSCLHCHMINAAEIELLRSKKAPLPDKILYPWPLPGALGLQLSPAERALVVNVVPSSAAHEAGFRHGDRILSLEGQPILSTADIQWVLHNAPSPAKLTAVVKRAEKTTLLKLMLDADWRKSSDISWRGSTWPLRRMGFGGMRLKDVWDGDRKKRGLEGMALWVRHVGQYGAHRAAKDAGFHKGDIVIEFDGIRERLTESELLVHIFRKRKAGDLIPVKILRGNKRMSLRLPVR